MKASSLLRGKVIIIICALAVILLALLLIKGWDRAQPEDPPKPPQEVQANDRVRFPDTPEGQAVMSHINAVYSVGPDAEANYQASLNVLRGKMNESVNILTTAYNEIDKKFYGDRVVLVQTLADLRGREALDPLTNIANEALPQKGTLYDHEISPYEEELIIRITAIKGIGNLSVRDDKAVSTLITFFNHADPTLRSEAVNALAQAIREADENRKRTLLQFLPKDYVFVPDLSRIQPPGVLGANPNQRPTGRGRGPAPSKRQ